MDIDYINHFIAIAFFIYLLTSTFMRRPEVEKPKPPILYIPYE